MDFMERVRMMPDPPRPPVDMLISIDGSVKMGDGLGGPEMMDQIKNGIQMIVNQTKIGNKNMQMGIMEYSNEVRKPLGFGMNQDMHGVEEANRGMNSSGAPPARHDLALKEVGNMFDAGRPRKEAVPRVAVFIITKKSPNNTETMKAAKGLDMKGGGIIRFVFVTDPMLAADPEIIAIASRPACNHVFKVRNPSEIVAWLDELSEEAAQVPVPMSDSYSKNSTIQCTLHGERRQVQEKVDPMKGRKFVLRVRGGNVSVYLSRTEPEPSAENHEYSAHATDGQNAEITVSSADMQNVNRQEFQGVSKRKRQAPPPPGGSMEMDVYSSIEGTGDIEFYSEEPRDLPPEQTTPMQTTAKPPIDGGKALAPSPSRGLKDPLLSSRCRFWLSTSLKSLLHITFLLLQVTTPFQEDKNY